MTLATDEFIRRFLLHVLPEGSTASVTTACSPAAPAPPISTAFHRLLAAASPTDDPEPATIASAEAACPCCGGRLVIIEHFRRGEAPRSRVAAVRIYTP